MSWKILVTIIVIITTALLRWRNRAFRRMHDQLATSSPSVPILGNALSFFGNPREVMKFMIKVGEELKGKNGVVSMWLINKFGIAVADADVAELILKKHLDKDEYMNAIKTVVGNASVFAPISSWRRTRKLVNPTFSIKYLNNYAKIFSKQSEVLVKNLQNYCGKGNFSIFKSLFYYSMDSVCETILGTEANAQNDPNNPALLAFERAIEKIAHRIVRPWLFFDVIYKLTSHYKELSECSKTIRNFVEKIIESKRKEKENQGNNISFQDQQSSRMRPFVELILDAEGGTLSNTDICDESMFMLLAATDTSANTIALVAILMAQHRAVQEKVYREIQEVLGDVDRPIEVHDLANLKYLTLVIKETLRLYPPLPLIVRNIDKSITLPSGVTLVPGVCVVIHIWALHRNPKYWGADADSFRPERFIDSPPNNPLAFMPFGLGPRNCVGYQYAMMSMTTVLATLVREYRLLPASKSNEDVAHDLTLNGNIPTDAVFNKNNKETITEEKYKGLRMEFKIVLRHSDNYELQLETRKLL